MNTNLKLNKSISSLAVLSAVLVMTGCSSTGSGSTGASLGGGGGVTATATPTGQVAGGAGNIVTATGNAVSDTGTAVGNLSLPIVPQQTQTDLGNVVTEGGGIVSTLGNGISSGLGQMGVIDNPVGVTVGSTGAVVNQTGVTVQSAGTLVSNLGTGQLAALAPVTAPVGGLVTKVGETVSNASAPLTQVLTTGPVEQLSLIHI